MNLDTKLFEDFCTFARLQINSTDIDPVYPVLKAYYDTEGYDLSTRVWKTFLYEACYNLASAHILWDLLPEPPHDMLLPLIPSVKTGIERRGFRGDSKLLTVHIKSFLNHVYHVSPWHTNLGNWISSVASKGWTAVRNDFEEIKYNGSWASFKWADLTKHVLGFPIEAADIGVGGKGETAGPIPGMVRLTGLDWKTCAEDVEAQKALLEESREMGVPFAGLDQLETSLCDFNSLCKKSYYIGHDIDMMQEGLPIDSPLWMSRKMAIPHKYLGELNWWQGIRKDMNSLYVDSRFIDWAN